MSSSWCRVAQPLRPALDGGDQLGQRLEVIMRLRELGGRLRAGALLAVPAFNPAHGEAETLRNADIVVLALCDMQEVLQAIAVHAAAPERVGKDARIGLAGAHVFGR